MSSWAIRFVSTVINGALRTLGSQSHFVQRIVDLDLGGTHLDGGVEQPSWADDLFDDFPVGVFHLPRARGRTHVDRLAHVLHELFELQRSVVQRARQTKPVLDQHFLACAVSAEHATNLRNCNMAFVHHEQPAFGKVFDECGRRFAGGSSGQMPTVVLDSFAPADFAHHL